MNAGGGDISVEGIMFKRLIRSIPSRFDGSRSSLAGEQTAGLVTVGEKLLLEDFFEQQWVSCTPIQRRRPT